MHTQLRKTMETRILSALLVTFLLLNLTSNVNAGTKSCTIPCKKELAKHLLSKAGITKGICSIPRCDDGSLVLAIAKSSDFLVHAQNEDFRLVQKVRNAADKKGLLNRTVVVEKRSSSVLHLTTEK